jgi:probable rRNA maturation factor
VATMSRKEPESEIQILNRQRRYRINRCSTTAFCSALLKTLGQAAGTLSVVFVSAHEMRRINIRYRQRNYATDVLSFRYEDTAGDGQPLLGEILICPEVAAEHALRYGTSHDRELRKLLTHGMLHLLGYDHEVDEGQMNRVQKNLLRRKIFKDSSSLIDTRMSR